MDETPNMALNMCGNLYLIISYLLKDESDNLEAKFQSWIDNVKG